MQLDQAFFDKEIAQHEKVLLDAQQQVAFVKGGLCILRQLRDLAAVETESPETVEQGE